MCTICAAEVNGCSHACPRQKWDKQQRSVFSQAQEIQYRHPAEKRRSDWDNEGKTGGEDLVSKKQAGSDEGWLPTLPREEAGNSKQR